MEQENTYSSDASGSDVASNMPAKKQSSIERLFKGDGKLWLILAGLGVVIVVLVVIVVINLTVPTIDLITAAIEDECGTEYFDSCPADVFSEYTADLLESGKIKKDEVEQYYEEMLSRLSDDSEARLPFLREYAVFVFNNEKDIEKAANILKRFEPYINNEDMLYESYYQELSDLYALADDDEKAGYYNELSSKYASREVYDLNDENDDTLIFDELGNVVKNTGNDNEEELGE